MSQEGNDEIEERLRNLEKQNEAIVDDLEYAETDLHPDEFERVVAIDVHEQVGRHRTFHDEFVVGRIEIPAAIPVEEDAGRRGALDHGAFDV